MTTLDVTDQAAYWSLHQDAVHGSTKTALGVWLSNAFPTDETSDDGSNAVAQRSAAIFKGYSRFNHSCIPNAHGCWNARRGKQTIHALRAIEVGEEVTVDYLGVCGAVRADRQRSLLTDMGFTCQCEACSLSGDAFEYSEARQVRIGELHAEIGSRLLGAADDAHEGAARVVQCVVAELLELMEVEGLGALTWDVLWVASDDAQANGDSLEAARWAARAAECACLAMGEESAEFERYHRREVAASPWSGSRLPERSAGDANEPLEVGASLSTLPRELLWLALASTDVYSLGVLAIVSHEYHDHVWHVLRSRAMPSPLCQPTDSLQQLCWRERRRYECQPQIIAAGAKHSALIDCEDGRLLTCGTDEARYGYLGQGAMDGVDPYTSFLLPSRVPASYALAERIIAVATHSLHTLFLTAGGECYSFGKGDRGQLGHGVVESQVQPRLIDELVGHFLTTIACGQQHSLALNDSAVLFSFGSGFAGKLGHGDQQDRTLPTRVGTAPFPDNDTGVGVVAAGAMHTLVATCAGALFAFGHGAEHQLGHGHRDAEHTPRRVEALRGVRIVQLAAGEHHSLAVDDAGALYSWGAGEARERMSEWTSGWLGHRNIDEVLTPLRVSALSSVRVLAVAAGPRHSLVLADGGEVYTFGSGTGGKLGHDDGERMHWVPRRVTAICGPVCAIAAGESHSLCALRDGRMLSWGAGGALGLPENLLSDQRVSLPASWASAGNYEWVPGDELNGARQQHRPTTLMLTGFER